MLPAPLTPYARLRWDLVAPLFPATRSRVLEIGCGQGAAAVRIAGRHDYTGVELDKASIDVARRRMAESGLGGRLVHGSLDGLADDELFDVVCAFEVLEHIEEDAKALAEWTARLRPGGLLLLSVPAWQSRYGPMDEAVGHFRRYDPEHLRGLLTDVDLDPVCGRLYGAPLGYGLEAIRNQFARRRSILREGATVEDRTARSGRLLQPSSALHGVLIEAGTWPFRVVQRFLPGVGTGLVAWGRVRG